MNRQFSPARGRNAPVLQSEQRNPIMKPADNHSTHPTPESPYQNVGTTYPRRTVLREALLSACTIGACVLCLLAGMRLTPPVQAQSTPTPTPTCPPPPPSPSPTCFPRAACANATPPCSPDATPFSPPTAVAIPSPFQPHDGTILKWRVFSPSGQGPWPGILLLAPDEFKGGTSTRPIA